MNFKVMIIFWITFSASLASASSLISIIPNKEIKLLNQRSYGHNDACTAFSLVYLMKLTSNPEIHNIYNNISGRTFEEKIDTFVSDASSWPSLDNTKSFALERGAGMSDFDLPKMFSRMTRTKASRIQPIRRDNETIGKFSRRIHSMIKEQIKNGIPILIGVYGRSYKNEIWKKKWGHAVLITGVDDAIYPADHSFNIEYLDPWTGRLHKASLYEESRETFTTFESTLSLDGDVEFKEKKVELMGRRGTYSSPSLLLNAPSMFAGYNLKNGEHEKLVLDNMLYFEPLVF